MEAPEKIYLERILCSNEVYDNWKSQKTISDDIEYVRTDVFTERVCQFLKEYQEYPNHDISTNNLLEAFKMYMEIRL